MNYFAHGRRFLADPYLLAGTAVPDWLSVVDRRVRARSRLARERWDDPDVRVAAVARGIVQHHYDDGWFHRTRAFAELSLEFAAGVRDVLDGDDSFRPGFLGHILVEILLDAVLIDWQPDRLDRYYEAMRAADPTVVGRAVGRMTTGTTDRLPEMIRGFCEDRFLYDYRDDARLLERLNRVMRRVKLAELPASFRLFLARGRRAVRRRAEELLDNRDRPFVIERGEIL